MKRMTILMSVFMTVCLAANAKNANRREFFAFDNGLTRIESLDSKIAVLKELGYDGIGWRSGRVPEILAVLDKYSLKMQSIYMGVTVNKNGAKYNPVILDEIKMLKDRGTIIWLFLLKGEEPNDESAVKVVREIGNAAKEVGLKVAIYPHVGFYLATAMDTLRVAKKVDMDNVGGSFNLCHFLLQNDSADLEKVIREMGHYLSLVSINGADNGAKLSMEKGLQRLDKGSFDNRTLLKILDDVGYKGPIGLQCYKIEGDDRENLAAAMTAWCLISGQKVVETGSHPE